MSDQRQPDPDLEAPDFPTMNEGYLQKLWFGGVLPELPHRRNYQNTLTSAQENFVWVLYYFLSFGFPAMNGVNMAIMWWRTGYWYDGVVATVWFVVAILLPFCAPLFINTSEPSHE